jgi:hypothetical protein
MISTALTLQSHENEAGLHVSRRTPPLRLFYILMFELGTTDAIFLEKPALYDLLLDLTVSTTSRNSRPDFYIPARVSGSKSLRLQTARFTFSDLRVWCTLDQILQADAAETVVDGASAENGTSGRWTDPSRLYEEVCILCAGLWMGGCRHTTGPIRLEGDETTSGSPISARPRPNRTSSTMSLRRTSDQDDSRPTREVRTTLALLDAFHYHVSFLVERLSGILSLSPAISSSPLVLTPRDLSGLQLGPFSEMDARFVEGFVESRFGRRVTVRRTWKDLMSAFLTLNW